MRTQRTLMLRGVALVVVMASIATLTMADDKKDGKKEEKKSGVVVGQVSAKGENWVEVKADGEEKGRRYVPHWVGGAPAQGGGPDKKMLEVIRGLKTGSRVRLTWEFEERARVVKVEVLREAETPKDGEKKGKEPEKKGTAVGTLTAREENFVEVKADGEEKARRYMIRRVESAEFRKTIKDTPLQSRVRVEWGYLERPVVLKFEVLKVAEKREERPGEKEPEKKGTAVGVLTAKDDKGIEVRADGEEKGRRYAFHFGGTPELHKAIKEAALGSRVRVEWTFIERPRVLKLELLKSPDKSER